MRSACLALVLAVTWVNCSVLIPAEDGSNGFERNVVDQGAHEWMEECARKDSISCLQMQMFRMAKDFFERPSFEIYNGITLALNQNGRDDSRALKEVTEESISKARNVGERENLLETYVVDEARAFFERRSVRWNLAELASTAMKAAPERFRNGVSELFADEEGRGRRKVLRMLIPILLAMKAKFATVIGLAYLGVILLAKKALVLSIVSLAMSAFLFVKKMFSHHSHEEVYPAAPAWHGHSAAAAGHLDYASSHPAPVVAAQQLAYGVAPIKARR